MTKETNYTPEQVTQLVEAYVFETTQETRDSVVEYFAIEFGKSVQSIRAKLSREGVYVAKAVAQAEKTVSKADYIDQLADEVGVPVELFESLTKANKNVLERLLFAFIEDRIDTEEVAEV